MTSSIERTRAKRVVIIISQADIGYALIASAIRQLLAEAWASQAHYFVIQDKNDLLNSRSKRLRLSESLDKASLIIWGGGPLYWPYAERAPWANHVVPLIEEAVLRGTPLWSLGVGCCYAMDKGGSILGLREEELQVASRILKLSSLVTARGASTSAILDASAIPHKVLPCLAGLMQAGVARYKEKDRFVSFNYMRAAGHHDYSNEYDPRIWHEMIGVVSSGILQRFPLRFVAHNLRERELVPLINPAISLEMPDSPRAYARYANNVLFGLNNRIHATVALAAYNIPSVTVGTDSRLETIDEFGLPTLTLQQAVGMGSQRLLEYLLSEIDKRDDYVDALKRINQNARETYRFLFRSSLAKAGLMD